MKRALLIALAVIMSILAFVGVFAWKNLRGIGPALRKPPLDLARVIDEQNDLGTVMTGTPLKLPEGFRISIFAKDLGDPRVLALDPAGTLLVSVPHRGMVLALPDANGDGKADRAVAVIKGLNRPHGLAFRCAPDCRLYIAEEDRVGEYVYDQAAMKAVLKRKIAGLPAGGFHVTRSLLFSPKPHDEQLLISVGSSCNVCVEKDPRRAAVLLVSVERGGESIYASGLRNAVFLRNKPGTNEMWVTEMGRDMLGDDLPPDEINILRRGADYGWPYCYGKNVHDDEFDSAKKHPCGEPRTTGSFIDIPAHSAPLGLAFFSGKGWPPEFENDLLVAYHGSWNRSVPNGYKIVRHRFGRRGDYRGAEDFITGWLTPDNRALGRPVDILIRPDRTILVSDDKAGLVYRIIYSH